MTLSSDPKKRAIQMANLKPISADPKRASETAKAHGFGSGKLKRCAGINKGGGRCGAPAAYGTDKCVKHGARKLAGKDSPNRDVRAAREAIKDVPRELEQTPEWQATDAMGSRKGLMRKAALLAAWRQTEKGNWAAWRMLTRKL